MHTKSIKSYTASGKSWLIQAEIEYRIQSASEGEIQEFL